MWVRIPPAAPVPGILDIECIADPPDVQLCADRRDFTDDYVYLLGLYLGDGMLTLAPKRVWRLRIVLDQRYPQIIERCEAAASSVSGRKANRVRKPGCFEVYSNWKHWRCLIPQHGPGPKHRREIRLVEWQQQLVAAYPGELLRGLIHSDGCRCINRVIRPLRDGPRAYEYPRYLFSNKSADIRAIFVMACTALEIPCRANGPWSISVAHRRGVQILEKLVGPKR